MQQWGIDEYEEIDEKGKVLVKVGAPYCKPCKELQAKLEKREGVYEWDFVSIDVEALGSNVCELGVTDLPTTFLFIDGQQRDHFEGCPSDEQLHDTLDLWNILR